MRLNSAPARCEEAPLPEEPKESRSPPLSRAISACTSRAWMFGFTASTLGMRPSGAIGEKSFTGS